MRLPFSLALALVAIVELLLPNLAQSAPAHVHGVANLDISIEGDRLSLALEAPLDALVGFERPPKTAKEKDAFEAMKKALNDAARLFLPTAAAHCTPVSVKLDVPFADGKPGRDGHGDVDVEYVFRCAQPAALKGVETSLFQSAHALYRIEVRRAGPAGQGSGRLTPRKPGISW